ncbi:HD domain-containing protein [Paenibacillus silvae]|uniref:GTP pyrophosphokinase n=1 Tax=Paenibacillus silvae TaxID=1325358 RepID=A0A2W6NQ50_9BACL|nr:HD domain-containing protein [Paenibacillus silvae]PZT57388.1 GTP pyrophosphokinase [Paenibacillus silvae]
MSIDSYFKNIEISNELSKAIAIAANLHSSQLDKGGNPYILHPLRVMMKMNDCTSMVVAVLHDVLEDTIFSIHDVKESGFSPIVIEALQSVSRKKDESYMEFIRRCKENEIGRKVKIADIEDNMDLSRIPNPTMTDYDRVKKYEKALKELLN